MSKVVFVADFDASPLHLAREELRSAGAAGLRGIQDLATGERPRGIDGQRGTRAFRIYWLAEKLIRAGPRAAPAAMIFKNVCSKILAHLITDVPSS